MRKVYEVEMKFAASGVVDVERRLAGLGGVDRGVSAQVDRYFGHPCRDFARTDEALRLRRVGDEVELTYKGPKIDATTKTRRELSLPLPSATSDGSATVEAWTGMLESLGFRLVAEVAKDRRSILLDWRGRRVEVTIDEVRGVGRFIEIESLAEDQDVDAARDAIAQLACALGLSANERRSYLEMLLAAGQGGGP